MTLVQGEGYQVPKFSVGDKIDCWVGESCEITKVSNAEVTHDTPFLQLTRPTKVEYQVNGGQWVQSNEVYGPEYSGKMFVFEVIE
jgi:hypothetical protein